MNYNPGTWFEIPVSNMSRAESFYSAVFGFSMKRQFISDSFIMSWFPVANFDAARGAGGALVQSDSCKPSVDGPTIYLSTSDIDATLKIVEEKGGRVLVPKTSDREIGTTAHFIDSEGNKVALRSLELA